jgi:putative oxidoreductase
MGRRDQLLEGRARGRLAFQTAWHGECGTQLRDELINVINADAALAVIRVVTGLVLAGHGAQKALGAFGGPGLTKWTGATKGMSFRPPRLWANAAAWGELLGGLALAVGFLTPFAAAVLAVDMLVAIWKVHWSKGLWVTKGGYEYALVMFCVFALIGMVGVTAYSVDELLSLTFNAPLLFIAAFVVGLIAAVASGIPGGAQRHAERPA